ncbi:hypothetical protein J4G08_10610 [Candidatus Poribacteria bacterium]|nr:hypothetical protein [Candidatus Poribacteria bacterium]
MKVNPQVTLTLSTLLLILLLLPGCGGDESVNPLVTETSADNEKEVPPTVQERSPIPEPEVPEPEPPLIDRGPCAVGMTLKPGEKCTYVANGVEVVFSVKQNGTACREGGPVFQEVLGVEVRIENLNICRDNDIERDESFNSNFSASKNPDGSWTIEKVP